MYTQVPLTPKMTNKMVQITVEILDILVIATKEMKLTRMSEFGLRFRFQEADKVPEKFVKRSMAMVVGRSDLEVGMKKLDKVTNEEVVISIAAQQLKVTHNIDKNVTEFNEGVRWV